MNLILNVTNKSNKLNKKLLLEVTQYPVELLLDTTNKSKIKKKILKKKLTK